ncbi:MAG TPA: xanthine dehydrogenase family protein molybdopterin-binding subunit [Gemmatimonadaceae bacterium]|nr:xanthine dehydrogenase family protein molybdopterin-binding subunit [Gemmatimonadaceae bacterium]
MTSTTSRRSFITVVASTGAGLVLGLRIESARASSDDRRGSPEWMPNAWLRINESGIVTIIAPKAEMGQGVFTALPMMVAEELDADWAAVRIEQSPARAPYDTTTGGSDSIRSSWLPLRQAGAAARAMLVAAAAAEWGVGADECRTEAGAVVHTATNRRSSYGALASRAAAMPLPDVAQLALKSPDAFRLIGKPLVRRDAAAKGDGSAIYGIDVKVPGMLVASVARCPIYNGRLAHVDATSARAVRGVRQVVTLDALRQEGLPARVAVVADSTWAAMKGRRALVVTWDGGSEGEFSSAAMEAAAREALNATGDVMQNVGDVEVAKKGATQTIERTYEVPLLAHATMEPMNCTAHVTDSSAELWVPTQFGSAMQTHVASFLNLPVDSVTVHVTFLGGGFGRRAYPDFVIDAVQIAKAVGAPVKVVWSREEDVQHDLYRPASIQRIRAALDATGRPVSWENRAAGQSNTGYWHPASPHPGSSEAPETIPYAMPNRFADMVYMPAPVPVGAWRAVRHTQNVFGVESFIDELAQTAGADPIEYRLALLDDSSRGRHVLELVRDRSGWNQRLAKGRGRGVAFMNYAGTYVAHVAEVTVEGDGNVRVDRVTCAFDCGQLINPDTVRAQIEGSVVWGMSAALWGEINVEHGRTVQSNFHDYRVARMSDAPIIDVHLVTNHESPSGVGEPAVPGVAPAIANAVFAASGRRVRRLPLNVRRA